MAVADPRAYLKDLVNELRTSWPDNRTHHIVCHGHSVPAGYFASGVVDTLNAYPHQLLVGLKERYPYASPEELHVRQVALFLDDSSMKKVYGWDPGKEGR